MKQLVMNETKKWHVVYTQPGSGKKVKERLTSNKIESYFPFNKVWKQWSGKKKIVLEPLFISYVFVHISDQEHSVVKKTNGIIDFLYWMDKPAVIRDEEIEAITDFMNQFANVKLEKSNVDMTIDGKVKITNNPFVFKQGNVMGVLCKNVNVYLPSLGYQMIAEVENSNIETVKEFEINQGLAS